MASSSIRFSPYPGRSSRDRQTTGTSQPEINVRRRQRRRPRLEPLNIVTAVKGSTAELCVSAKATDTGLSTLPTLRRAPTLPLPEEPNTNSNEDKACLAHGETFNTTVNCAEKDPSSLYRPISRSKKTSDCSEKSMPPLSSNKTVTKTLKVA